MVPTSGLGFRVNGLVSGLQLGFRSMLGFKIGLGSWSELELGFRFMNNNDAGMIGSLYTIVREKKLFPH